MARRFAKVPEEEIKTAFFYPSDLVNTKTTIPLRVGEERWIYTSMLRVSVYIHHYSPVYYYLLFCVPGTHTIACQENKDGNVRKSMGDIRKQTLQYADRQLTLIYQHGEKCSSGLNRTTIILFKCDVHAKSTRPVFSFESYCFYYFVWRTKYACAPSRRTGTDCRVESPNGTRYDLSALVRAGNEPNWLALDGEHSSSDKVISVNVCGQLTLQNQTSGCDRASAVCMMEKSTGNVIDLGRYSSPPSLNSDNSIKLVYTEGSKCKNDNKGTIIKRKSTITFVCQPGDLESPPVLVTRSADDCNFEFIWKTGEGLGGWGAGVSSTPT